MRSFRSTRISAVRLTAVAASGVIAMAVLTGCGDDDKDKSNPFGGGSSPKAPTATSSATDKKPSSDEPTSTSTKKPTSTAKPSSTDSGSTEINRIELKVGDCVDFDSSTKMSKASCTSAHDGETAGVFTLPSSMSPMSPTYEDDVEAKCEELVGPVIDRQANASALSFTFTYPSMDTWTMDNDRNLQCIVVMQNESPLPAGKLK